MSASDCPLSIARGWKAAYPNPVSDTDSWKTDRSRREPGSRSLWRLSIEEPRCELEAVLGRDSRGCRLQDSIN